GVFQLESNGIKRYLKELRPTCFDDIVAMIALYRPGPMELIPEYIASKNSRKAIEYIHPSLKEVLKNTYGLPVYQEQIMKIAQVLAGFSLAEADILRKAIGKKIKELLASQKEKFLEGCVKNNVSKSIADKVFSWIEPHASYSFNKSHAVAYGIIAYNTAYLKAHYPVEFMAALLTSEKNDMDKIAFVIDECKDMAIDVLAPDINESFRNFSVTPDGAKIRFGLLAIKNVGENIVEAILQERKDQGPFQSFSDFATRIDSKDFNKKSLESLIKSGAFDKFAERNVLLNNLEEALTFNREIRKAKANSQPSLFGFANLVAPSLRLADFPPATAKQKIMWEKELLGLYISSHPLDNFKNLLRDRATPLKELNNGVFYNTIRVGGIISSVKKIITKKGQPMIFLQLQDLTDKAEVVVFPSVLEANPEIFQENKIVLITGKKDTRNGEPKII
ncbi:MAG: DNA polymerase III subunit alpha, partial [Patescibacteria group bacterium]